MKNIVLFENKRVEDLYPFSVMHCSWEIRCGGLKLYEKYSFRFPKSEINFHGRKKWLASFLKRFNFADKPLIFDDTLFISGNVIISSNFNDLLNNLKEQNECFLVESKGNPIAFYCRKYDEDISKHFENNETIDLSDDLFSKYPKFDADAEKIEYLWDSIFINGKEIKNDAEIISKNLNRFENDIAGVMTLSPENILIGNDVKIAPGVVIDASEGAVILSDNVKIMPQSTIIGPCFIGSNSTIKVGAKIYEDCSIGEWCKIGGELENSIIHSYSNKQHEGFLGHSYICEWVNLGADTNNSDLKNTYGEINMVLPHKEVHTGRIFLGLMCGDHTKSGINSMFTTGTVAGVCGILVKEWFLPNFIKSFTWGGKANSPLYKFDKAIETARIVMNRRKRTLLDEEIELLKIEYERICS